MNNNYLSIFYSISPCLPPELPIKPDRVSVKLGSTHAYWYLFFDDSDPNSFQHARHQAEELRDKLDTANVQNRGRKQRVWQYRDYMGRAYSPDARGSIRDLTLDYVLNQNNQPGAY